MTTGVIYLMTGPQHGARLIVSLYTLRQWYDGPVTVFTTRPESHAIGKRLAASDELRVNHQTFWELPPGDYNASCATKPFIFSAAPYDASILLDADTMVVGPIDELVDSAQSSPLTVTTFCGSRTNEHGHQVAFAGWRKLAGRTGDVYGLTPLLDHIQAYPQWKINAGVVAARKGTQFLAEWQALSRFAQKMPLPEEVALQLLSLRYPHRLLGWKFNCFPLMQPQPSDVRIVHFAATSHLSHEATQAMWMPVYRECRRKNIADLRRWSLVRKRPAPRPLVTVGRKGN
jgi:hypothetical protein